MRRVAKRATHIGMRTVEQILTAVGGKDEMCAMFSVKRRVLDEHLQRGQFPAAWYAALEIRLDQRLPFALFNFKGLRKD